MTGAAGLLGSHLVDHLLRRDFFVTGIDNLSIGKKENLNEAFSSQKFKFSEFDVLDEKLFDRFDQHDIIVHMAAYKIEVPGLKGVDILNVNANGTHRMLELARRWNARFIFASTSDVYGKSVNFPFHEEGDLIVGAPRIERWRYAVSKMFDEHMCYAYSKEFKLPITIIRYFNTYGPRHDISILSGGPQALFFDAILRGHEITIHGDGSQRRCFAYVDDSIEMTCRVIESKLTINQVLNIGNPYNEISILNLAKLAHKISGGEKTPPIKFITHEQFYKTEKFEEVNRRIPDISKAERLLKYSPKITNEEGLKRTFEWQRKQDCYQ